MSTAGSNWDWDWENQQIDSTAPRAQVDPNAELRPIAVDESLTTLLFSARPANAPTPMPTATPEPEPEPMWVDVQGLLFEPA